MQKTLRVVTIVLLVSCLTGCATATEKEPLPKPLASATDPPAPTVTPSPTRRPQPTSTAEPTETPLHTATPQLVTDVIPTLTSLPTTTATRTLAPQPTPTPAVSVAPIRSITVDSVGEEITLEGKVVNTASFSKGFQFTLDDGTGQIVLLTWHDVYDDCWDAPELNLGAVVRVTGKVSEYEGQLEIQPHFGGDIRVVQEATTQAPRRDIGSITGTDEGQCVMIEGRVVRTEGLSSAVKVFLADDSGEILVFIWRNVLDRISDNTGLGTPDSLVRVVGAVQTYRANLEIVPPLPNDVTVLEIPGKETE
jgi:DNA/RNA endonuclease YhcR with UshA esterase domain